MRHREENTDSGEVHTQKASEQGTLGLPCKGPGKLQKVSILNLHIPNTVSPVPISHTTTLHQQESAFEAGQHSKGSPKDTQCQTKCPVLKAAELPRAASPKELQQLLHLPRAQHSQTPDLRLVLLFIKLLESSQGPHQNN